MVVYEYRDRYVDFNDRKKIEAIKNEMGRKGWRFVGQWLVGAEREFRLTFERTAEGK